MKRRLLQAPNEWTIDDVQALVDVQMPEGQRIEYKESLSLDKRSEKREIAKDVSGLANAQGGWIIYGIPEDGSEDPLPLEVRPFHGPGTQTRAEDVLDGALSPRPDFAVATIDLKDSGIVLLIKVEACVGGPVMVQGYGENRYYRRSGTRTRPMDSSEVAAAHARAASRIDELEARVAGLPLVPRLFRPRSADVLQMENPPKTWPPLGSVVVAAVDVRGELIPDDRVTTHEFPEDTTGYRR